MSKNSQKLKTARKKLEKAKEGYKKNPTEKTWDEIVSSNSVPLFQPCGGALLRLETPIEVEKVHW